MKRKSKQKQLLVHKKKISIGMLCVIIIILILFILYWLIDPILDFIFGYKRYECKDIDVYTTGEYLSFEDGYAFHDFTSKIELTDCGEIVSFYYVNHYGQDNPIYGQATDVYAVDILIDTEEYENYKQSFIDNSEDYGEYGVFQLYQYNIVDKDGNHFIIAFDDEQHIGRFIMMTDIGEMDFVHPYLVKYASGLEFEKGYRQLD